jgi:glycosyltransferase involved in cell wall biosynthesis
MTQPIDQLVSIILPVRNSQATLASCLESLLNQTYQAIEIIAIDDKSYDTSYSILRKYRRQDKRLQISRNVKNYGLTVTLNRALKKARGSYIAFVNEHDIMTPDKIKRQVYYLKRHPKVVALGTQVIFIDPTTGRETKSEFPTDHETISKTFLTSDALQLESILINRYLIPRDLLKFDTQKYPLIYRALIAKLLPYGNFANLNQHLYLRIKEGLPESLTSHIMRNVSLWTKSRFIHGTGISWNSLLYPVNNKIKSAI